MRGTQIAGICLVVIGLMVTAAPAGAATVLVDYEDLVLNTQYFCCGPAFNSAGMDYSTEQFQWSNGIWTPDGYAEVVAMGMACGTRQEIWINNINLRLELPVQADLIELDYGEYGGNLNIEITGVFQNFANMQDINGMPFGAATVSVVDYGVPGNSCGHLTVRGPVDSFSIGGQEFVIDNMVINTPGCFIGTVLR